MEAQGSEQPLSIEQQQNLLNSITEETLEDIKPGLPDDPTGETVEAVKAEIHREAVKQLDQYVKNGFLITKIPWLVILGVPVIIFMVVTPLIQRGVDVRLPAALNTINMPENPEVVLSIKKDGSMYIGQDQVTMENLQTLIEEAFMTASDKRLYLRADGELEYGNIVDIVEILKAAGVEIVGIITEVKTETID